LEKSDLRARHISNIAVVSVALWVGVAASLSQAAEPVTIAILPIVVHSADDPTYLRKGLADMLASRIEQAGGFELIRVEDLELATTRLSQAIETASEVGAEFVLFGSFTRFGTGASLDMQCVSTSDDFEGVPLREIFVHSGSIGEVIPDLDELVGKVGRFAIAGFGAPADVASAPPVGSDPEPDPGLEARIEALEKAMAELTAAPEPANP
jgi:TolB-like protein